MGRRRKIADIPEGSKEAEENLESEWTTDISEGSKEVEEENPELEWQLPTIPYILDLPCNLILDIFLRLPLKTLFSCRCVCKTWRIIFSDPRFAKLHLSRSPINLLVKTFHRRRESRMLHLIDLQGADTGYLDAILKFTQKTNLPNFKVNLVNSCNGLLCLSPLMDEYTEDFIYICNPIMGEYITLPKPQKGMTCAGAGLGFSHETDEYKVIRTLSRMNSSNSEGLNFGDRSYEAEIYTLGGGAWRSIGNVPYSVTYDLSFNNFLNGAIHWLVHDSNSPDYTIYICFFHFGNEQFVTIALPAPIEKKYMDSKTLGVLEGCLYVCDCTDYSHTDLWVMKNYGVRESWTKVFVIENLIFEKSHSDIYEPILTLESGEILMLFNEQALVLYSPEKECFDFLDVYGVKSKFHAIAHIPSFVSLRDVANGEDVKVRRNNRAMKRSRKSLKEVSKEDDDNHGEQDQTPRPKITDFPSHIETLEEDDDDCEQDQTPNPSITFFPSHILMDILSRLSVKTVFTCRRVCKLWYNLLSDPLFARLHFTRAPTCPLLRNPNGSRIRKSLYLVELERDSTCVIGRNCDIKKCIRYSGEGTCNDHVNMKLSTKFGLPNLEKAEMVTSKGFRYMDRDFDIVNSCNGLLCLCGSENDDPIVIYNPVVGEYVSLPKLEKDTNTRIVKVCGLGFSAKTNQYKVLKMLRPTVWDPMVSEIHTLGSGFWRRIRNVTNVPHSLIQASFPTFLNGALHWFCKDNGSCLIVSFDFEDEQFQAITPPRQEFGFKTFDFWTISRLSMGVLRGCLYICDSSSCDSIYIWVMKDYGVKESWTKEYEIDTANDDRWPIGLYQPIDFLNNGDLLMYQANNALISYKRLRFQYFKIHDVQSKSKFQAIAHIPSFVSLKEMIGDNVEVLNVRSRFANVEPQQRRMKSFFLVELNRDVVSDSDYSN